MNRILHVTFRCCALLGLIGGGILGSARAQGMLFQDDFEGGLASWITTGLWHLQTDSTPCFAGVLPLPSPGHCAWMGQTNTCSFDTGAPTAGLLQLTAPVSLPATTGTLVLRYRTILRAHDACFSWDQSSVWLSGDGGATWSIRLDCIPTAYLGTPWARRRFDLSAYAGASVLVRFWFDSVDGFANGDLGWLIDDVSITDEPGTDFCRAGPACPCSNFINGFASGPDDGFGGCINSRGIEAELFGSGMASVAADTVVLHAADIVPNTVALYAQAAGQGITVFGDGLRCIAGSTIRMAVHSANGYGDQYPRAGEQPVSVRGLIPAGGVTRYYQVVYRDAASFCMSGTFASTNGYRIDWLP